MRRYTSLRTYIYVRHDNNADSISVYGHHFATDTLTLPVSMCSFLIPLRDLSKEIQFEIVLFIPTCFCASSADDNAVLSKVSSTSRKAAIVRSLSSKCLSGIVTSLCQAAPIDCPL